MIELLVFDLDSTLAPLGEGIGEEELSVLKEIGNLGIPIVICSGKTCDYLCGFMRQTGIKEPILIGENGAVIRFGIDLPPKRHCRVPFSAEAEISLEKVRKVLKEKYPYIWFQPNKVGVTPFPVTQEEFEEIEQLLMEHQEEWKGVTVFRHIDSFDIVPSEIDKAGGISFLLELLKIPPQNIIAAGDGVNDYGMFALAGTAVGVNVKDASRVSVNCKSTMEMLVYIRDMLKKVGGRERENL